MHCLRRNIGRRKFSLSQIQMQKPLQKPEFFQLLIDGKFVDAEGGKTFPTFDPRTEEHVGDFSSAAKSDVDAAVKSCRKAFDEGPWPRMSGYERGRILNRIGDLLKERLEYFAALETLDNGKPILFSRIADVPLSYQHFHYYSGLCDKIHGETITHDAAFGKFDAKTLKEPIGVAAQIIPWNFPLLMAAWKLGPSLASGSCVVLKPSEKTPMTALALGKLMLEAGLPEGVVNIVTGPGDVGAELSSHPGIDKVAFTGSVSTALKVKQQMGIKPFTSELGGKSPVIIYPDYNVDEAVALANWALFFNHGQCCCAGSRVFVHDSIHNEFVDKSIKAAEARKVGDPFGEVDQGPQVDKIQFDKIMSYIAGAKNQGIDVATGGGRVGDKGYFVEPTIFVDVPDSATMQREEIFGPVMGIAKWNDEDDVLRRCNDSNFGLAAGIFSNDTNTINRATRKIRAGTVWVNCFNNFDAATPFGGYKDSGVGREKGVHAVENYLQTKTVIQALPSDKDLGWYR